MPIDAGRDAYVLEGRIVTMGSAGVIDEGRVYIQGDTIVDVLDRQAPRPDGFTGAKVVKLAGHRRVQGGDHQAGAGAG